MVFNVRPAEHLELELSEDDVAKPPQDANDSSSDEPPPRHSGVGYRAEVLVVSFPLFSCWCGDARVLSRLVRPTGKRVHVELCPGSTNLSSFQTPNASADQKPISRVSKVTTRTSILISDFMISGLIGDR